jgi:spermidine/putrescine transport system substrate-binding protein
MKAIRIGILAAATAAAVGLWGCGSGKPVLHLYNWADYIDPALMERFEAENGCRIVLDTFDSNENMYAKLKAGATGYDIAVPSSYMIQIMRHENMLEPLKRELLPNVANVDPMALKVTLDTEMQFCVPYTLSYTAIGYRKSKVQNLVESWSMFDREDLKGRMTLLNDMRETVSAALRFCGFSGNSTKDEELQKAKEVVLRWKKNIAKFENEQYKPGLASGEFLLVMGYVGDLLQIQAENDDIGIFFPKEGFVTTCDCVVIPKGARNVELAHKFINFLHDPRVAAQNTAFTKYLCPNKAAYEHLPKEIRDNPAILLPPERQAVAEVNLDLGDQNQKFIKLWDEIKGGE